MRNWKNWIRITYKVWRLQRKGDKVFKKWEKEFDEKWIAFPEPPEEKFKPPDPPLSYHEMRKQRFKDFYSGPFTKWKKKNPKN